MRKGVVVGMRKGVVVGQSREMAFLSHSVSPADSAVAARLRAVAAVNGITLELPRRGDPVSEAETNVRIGQADIVIGLVTRESLAFGDVLRECSYAIAQQKPVILLVEDRVALRGLPATVQVVRFSRGNPFSLNHEAELVAAVHSLQARQRNYVFALSAVALGMLGLGVLANTGARTPTRKKQPIKKQPIKKQSIKKKATKKKAR
jgi:hypothetical protein